MKDYAMFQNLSKSLFFEGFEFNKLNDFQLEPPYKPPVKNDISKFLKNTEPYESIFKDEKESNIGLNKKRKNRDDDENSDYDPNWVEVF